MWDVIKRNPISAFAVLLVALIGSFLGYTLWWETTILTSPEWCQKAQRAEQIAPGQTVAQSLEMVKSCNDLLMVQLQAVATDSHFDHGTFSTLVIVLVIVVVAGARASWKLSPTGLEGSLGREAAISTAAAAGAAAGVAAATTAAATNGAAPAAPAVPPPEPPPPGSQKATP